MDDGGHPDSRNCTVAALIFSIFDPDVAVNDVGASYGNNMIFLFMGSFLTFLPLAGGVAMGMDLDLLLLTIPVALAATCAFMLPVATHPNAVSYASVYITIGQMMRGGLWLNLIAIALITVASYTVFAWSLGIAS